MILKTPVFYRRNQKLERPSRRRPRYECGKLRSHKRPVETPVFDVLEENNPGTQLAIIVPF